MKIISRLFDFIVPRFCISCDVQLATNEIFTCKSCMAKIKFLSDAEISKENKRKFGSTLIVVGKGLSSHGKIVWHF